MVSPEAEPEAAPDAAVEAAVPVELDEEPQALSAPTAGGSAHDSQELTTGNALFHTKIPLSCLLL